MGLRIICCFFGFLLLFLNNKKLNFFGLFLVLLGISYIASIRPETSADTQNYLRFYEESRSITNYSFSIGRTYHAWVEDWYLNFCSIFSKNGIDFRLYLFIVAFIINSVSIYAINKLTSLFTDNKVYFPALLLLYISNYGFLYSYVVIRGGLSFAFSILGIYYFLNKKYIKTILFVLVSVALHNYSLVIIAVLLLIKFGPKRLTAKTCAISFMILLAMAVLRVDVFFTNYVVRNFMSILNQSSLFSFSHYLQEAASSDGIKKGTVLILVQSLYITYLFRNEIDKSEQLSKYMFILIIGGAVSVLLNNNATARMSNYFTVYQIVLFMKYLSDNFYIDTSFGGLTIDRRVFYQTCMICAVFPILNLIYILRYCSVI